MSILLIGALLGWLVLLGMLPPVARTMGLLVALFLPLVAYLFAFRLRRIMDIGFGSHLSALIAMVLFALVAYGVSRVLPTLGGFLAIAIELAILVLPTGANIRKTQGA